MPISENYSNIFDENEDDFRFNNQVIGIVPNIVYVLDLSDQKVIFVNKSIDEALGYSPEEFIELSSSFFGSLMHPDDLIRLAHRQKEIDRLEDGKNIEFEYRLFHRSGEWRWFLSRDSIFKRDKEGKPLQIIGTATDITSRKLIEEKLQNSENRLNLAMAVAGFAICEIDYSAKVNHLSKEAAVLYGFGTEAVSVSLDTFHSTFHPDDYPKLIKLIKKSLNPNSDGWFAQEHRVLLKNGEIRWLNVRKQNFFNPSGIPTAGILVSQDITERKKAQAALERYRILSENARDIVWIARADGQIVEVNQAAVDTYGYSKAELLQMNIGDLREEKTRSQLPVQLQEALNSGIRFETIHLRKDGTTFSVEVNSTGADFGGEKLIMSIIRDTTERKLAEETLREEKQFSQNIIEAAPNLTYLFDVKTKSNIFISPLVVEILGYSPEELQDFGEELSSKLIHPDDKERSNERFEKFISSKDSEIIELEYRMKCKDGSFVWLNDRARVFRRDSFGQPTQILGVATDITSRKNAEESRQQFVSLIEQTNDFVGMAKLSGEILYTNPAGRKMIGKETETENFPQTFPDFHPPSTVKLLKEIAIPKVMEKGFWEGETQFINFSNGELIDAYQKIFPIRHPKSNELICLATTAVNITERKKVQEALKREQEFTRSIIETAPSLTYIYDINETRNVFISNQIHEVLGFDAKEIEDLGEEVITKLLHPEDTRPVAERFERILADRDNETYQMEYRMLHKSGEFVWLFDRTRVFRRNSEGVPIQILGVATVITERKKIEQKLAEQRRLYKSVTDNATTALFIMDEKQQCLFMNPAAEHLTGFKFVEINSRPLHEIIHHTRPDGSPYPLSECPIDQAFPNRQQMKGEEVFVHKDGYFYNVAFCASPIINENGVVKGTVIEVQDITQQKRREENLVFLSQLQNEFARLTNVEEITRSAGKSIAEYLKLSQCIFVEIDENAQMAAVFYDSREAETENLIGNYDLADFHSANERALLSAGISLVINNIRDNGRLSQSITAFEKLGISSLITIPYISKGRWTFALSAQCIKPRQWREDQIELLTAITSNLYLRLERARAEEALRESEARFRSLFESIDEGFVIVELLFDDSGNPVDYRFEQANQAFNRLTGLSAEAIGKTALELVPNLESFWIETYGRVALTGESVRFENQSVPMNRWFEVHASRVGGEESRRVAIVFNNITKRKIEELKQGLLLRLDEFIRNNDNPDNIFNEVAAMLGECLSVTRCGFNEIDLYDQTVTVRNEFNLDSFLSYIGKFPISNYSTLTRSELEAGKTVVVHNTQTDSRTADWFDVTYEPENVAAYISFPLLRENIWKATLWVSINSPRQWQDWEIDLVKTVGERTWLAVEKIRNEQKVIQSEERLRLATDAAEMFSWETDLVTQKIKWSENAAKILNCSPENLSEDTTKAHFFIPPDESKRISQEFEEAIASSETNFSLEFRGNSNLFWQTHFLIARDAKGNPVKSIGVTQNVTERKKAEDALRQAELRFRSTFEQAAVGIGHVDPDGKWLLVNERLCEIVGYSREELLGSTFQDITHPDDLAADLDFVRQVLAGEIDNYSMNKRYIRKNGSIVWINLTVSLVRSAAEGIPQYFIAVIEDITERKRVEEKLQTANYRFRIAEEAAKSFNYEWNLETGVVTRSISIKNVLGYEREEIKMNWQAWVDLIHPDDLSVHNEAEAVNFLNSLKEETFSGEYRIRHKNGKHIWLMERGLIIRNDRGTPIRVIGQTMDVTQQKEQEKLLRLSEERYRALAEASAQVVWSMDADGKSDSHRHWFASLTGKTLEEIKEVGYLSFVHPADRQQLQRIWQAIIKKPQQYEVEFRLAPKGQNYRYYALRGVPLLKEDGTLREWIGTVRDITERKTAEESLRESEEYRRLLIESARDYAIIGVSIEGIILSWNTGAEQIFGYHEDEIIGQSAGVLFTPEDRLAKVSQNEIETALKSGAASDERWHIRKDGSRFFASGVLHQLKSENGQILGFVKIARDQTQKLAAEKAIQDRAMLQKVVGALEDERRRIARDLHDELGQQLTALRLKLENVRRSCPDENISLEIDKIQDIAKQIDDGVDFLAWELRPAVLDDLGLYAALEKYVREWSNYSSISAEILPSGIKGERFSSAIETNLYRITQEALNNISKHSQAKYVEIVMEKRDDMIILIIADNGKGFNLNKKFENNKGIGLIGMQERASLIGGTFEIESSHGSGTTIFVKVKI